MNKTILTLGAMFATAAATKAVTTITYTDFGAVSGATDTISTTIDVAGGGTLPADITLTATGGGGGGLVISGGGGGIGVYQGGGSPTAVTSSETITISVTPVAGYYFQFSGGVASGASLNGGGNVTMTFGDGTVTVSDGTLVPVSGLGSVDSLLFGSPSASKGGHFYSVGLEAVAVPEPSSSVFLGLGALALLRRRRE